MEPIEYARLIRRRWRVVAACALVAAVAVWVVTPSSPEAQEPRFVAEHTLIREAAPDGSSSQALASVGLIVRTGEVPRRVATRVGWDRTPAILARSATVISDEQLGTLAVRATAGGRRAASDLANAFAEETLALLGERAQQARDKTNADLQARLTKRQASIDDLARQIAAGGEGRSADLLRAQRDAELSLYQSDLELQQKQADLPPPTAGYITLDGATPELASPKGAGFGVPASRPVRTLGAGLVGLLLGAIVVLVVERVDPRIHLRAGAERAFRLPVIAEIPYATRRRRADVLTVTEPSSGIAEAYRALRAALLLMPANLLGDGEGRAARRREQVSAPAAGSVPVVSILGPTGVGPSAKPANGEARGSAPPRIILVTSAAPSEGKTATVANLAASFAETSRSVLVLSCDFRRPSIHEYLGVRQAWGLTEVLENSPTSPDLADVIKDSTIPGVRIATNGSPLDGYGEVAAAGRSVVAKARRLADVVIIDTAPLLVAHEATELVPAADTVVLVCRSGQTTKEDAARARELLSRLSAPVAGVVLIGAPDEQTGYSTYYYRPSQSHKRSLVRWLLNRPLVEEEDEPRPPEPPKRKAVI